MQLLENKITDRDQIVQWVHCKPVKTLLHTTFLFYIKVYHVSYSDNFGQTSSYRNILANLNNTMQTKEHAMK